MRLCNPCRINLLAALIFTDLRVGLGSVVRASKAGDRILKKDTAGTQRAQRPAKRRREVNTPRGRGQDRGKLAVLLLVVLGYAGFYDLFHEAGGEWFVGGEANGAF